MKPIIHFFAKEHLFGNLLTLLILGAGILAFASIRRDIWPEVNFDITVISTALPGASPQQVEKLVLNPLEEAIREVDGLKKVTSTATESTAITVIQLDPDARDADKTNTDIQRAVDRIDDFPEEVEKPTIRVVEAAQSPIIELNVSGTHTPLAIRKAAKFVSDKLSLMRGVSGITKNGFEKREFLVSASPKLLAKRKVSLSNLINTISLRNVSIPAGTIENKKGLETLVRTEAQYNSSQNILDSVLVTNEAGYGTRISDVATVKETLAEPKYLFRANGERAINLTIRKKKNADVLNLVKEIKKYVSTIKDNFGDKIHFTFSNNFTVYLKNRLGALSSNLLIGLGLVFLILTLFLPWQVTLVVAVGIPLALMASLYLAFILGFSLNIISLIGLIIVLGMLVDDAIVVSENIWRHVEEGKEIKTAIVDGASEVFAPVLASILTTVSAFAPMMFMTGIFGAFIFEIPAMVIIALVFSLLEAFLIMPSHFVSWVGPSIHKRNFQQQDKNSWFDKFTQKYQNYVRWSLKRRYLLTFALVSFITATGVLLFASGRFILFPPEGVEIIFVSLESEQGTSIENMEKLVLPAEEIISDLPSSELKDFFTAIGIIQQEPNDPFTKRGSHYANIRISLTPQRDRQRTAKDIVSDLRKKMDQQLPGIQQLRFDFARQGPPQGSPISINIIGNEFKKLRQLAKKIEQELAKIDGVTDIRNSFTPGKKEWQVIPRHQDSSLVGLSATQISTSVRAAFEGVVASSIRQLDEEVDIRVKLLQTTRLSTQEQLEQLSIGNPAGYLVPLKSIADFNSVDTLSSIRHLDYQRVVNVSADVDLKKITALQASALTQPIVEKLMKDHPEVSIQFGGEDQDTQESMQSLMRAFIFAAFIIFSLLIIVFRNLIQPILILTSIPLGFTGVVYSMLIHNRPFSFMAMLGVIALAGVIVNNAIVFIDFVNNRRKNSHDPLDRNLDESIVDAAGVRLRPIVLTTVTTICGLLPTAYGDVLRTYIGIGGGDPFIIPIALALGWGLAFGTIMIGIFFPALIRVVDDLRRQKPKELTH